MVPLTFANVMIGNQKSSVSLDETFSCKTMSLKCGVIESEHEDQKFIRFIWHCRPTVQLRYMRTTHTRMSIHAHKSVHVYVFLLCIPISFFIRSIAGQTKDLLFFSQIHRQTCSILSYQKWEQNLYSRLKFLFRHVNFMFLQRKFCVSALVGKSFAKCLFA